MSNQNAWRMNCFWCHWMVWLWLSIQIRKKLEWIVRVNAYNTISLSLSLMGWCVFQKMNRKFKRVNETRFLRHDLVVNYVKMFSYFYSYWLEVLFLGRTIVGWFVHKYNQLSRFLHAIKQDAKNCGFFLMRRVWQIFFCIIQAFHNQITKFDEKKWK